MFLNKTILKKFIKASFRKEGLVVGRIYGGLVVAGGTWSTWTEDGYVPNWLKAAVMEYTGELPDKERVFKAKKDEPIQYEIADNQFYNLPEAYRRCRTSYTVTPIVVKDRYYAVRLLQQDAAKRMTAVQEIYHEIIDLSELEDENAPGRPVSLSENSSILIYKNEHSAYAFAVLDGMADIVREIAEHVDVIDFRGEAS